MRRALTPWRAQRDGLVRIQKGSERARGHSHPAERIGMDKFGHGKQGQRTIEASERRL